MASSQVHVCNTPLVKYAFERKIALSDRITNGIEIRMLRTLMNVYFNVVCKYI